MYCYTIKNEEVYELSGHPWYKLKISGIRKLMVMYNTYMYTLNSYSINVSYTTIFL
jgi:hypothetical protein